MRHPTFLVVAAAIVALAGGQAHAKQCRDANGHYVKCPAAETTAAPTTSKTTTTKATPSGSTTTTTTKSATATPQGTTTTTTTKKSKTAKNATNETTASAASSAAAPAGAVTAKCKDGTVSHAQHHSGACAHHGGVAAWM